MTSATESITGRVEKLILDELELAGSSWVTVAKLKDGQGWHLSWHDGVANAWSFEHPLLSVVLLRLATLARCGETDFWGCFTYADDDDFAAGAAAFLAEQVCPPNENVSASGRVITWHGGPPKPKITRPDDDTWLLWIPPTSIWCYEGGTVHGALLSPWGDTYWDSHEDACTFLGQAILEGKA